MFMCQGLKTFNVFFFQFKMSWACDPVLTNNIVNSYQVAGPLFMSTLQTFFAAQCALVGDHLWPADAINSVLEGN